MKKLMPPKRLTRYLLAAALLTGLFIYGCKKEFKETFAPGNPVIEEAKSWYETEYPGNPTSGKNIIQDTKSTDKEPLDFTHKIKPDWKHFANYKRLGKDVIEMPIDSQSKMGAEFKNMTTGGIYSDKKYNRTYFLLLKDSTGYKAYVMMIMADPAYVNNDFSKLSHNTYKKHDADFSGLILYFTPKGRYLGGYKYVNGQLIMPGANVATNQVQNVAGQNSKTVNTVTDCYSFFLITYYTDGTTDELYLGTICNGPCNQSIKGNGCPTGGDGSGGGGSPGNPPPPPNCNPYSPINQSLVKLAYVDNGDTGAPPPRNLCDSVTTDSTASLENLIPQNKLCSSTFKFTTIVSPDPSQNSRGWKESSVSGLTINVVSDNYFENIWDVLTNQSAVTTGVFNLEIGVPGDLPDQAITSATALAANIAMVQIEKIYGIDGMKNLIQTGTLGFRVAKIMQIQLQSFVPGSRVSTSLSGRTIPTQPITGLNCQ